MSQGRALDDIMPDDTAFRQLVAVLGVSDAMGKLMRFRPDLVQPRRPTTATVTSTTMTSAGRTCSNPSEPTRTTACPRQHEDLADAATALRRTYRNQLAAIIAQDTMSDDPIALQPRISSELSDLADAALEGALAIARHEIAGSEHCRFAIIGMASSARANSTTCPTST